MQARQLYWDYPKKFLILHDVLKAKSPLFLTLQGSPAAYHILIAFAHRSQKLDAIPGLTAHMDSRGIPFTPATYATLVDVYTRAKDTANAQAWFDKLLAAEAANKWRPESSAYRAMMSMYEKVRKPSESVRVWRQLLARGPIHIGALQTYNALVDALGKAGRFEEAMGLLEEMRGRGLQPNTMTYNMLINCYGKVRADDEHYREGASFVVLWRKNCSDAGKTIRDTLGKVRYEEKLGVGLRFSLPLRSFESYRVLPYC